MIRIRETIAVIIATCSLVTSASAAELAASEEPGWPQWRGPRRDGYLYHMNANGRLVCLDATNGSEVWSTPTLEKYASQNITWGIRESPLVADGKVYVTPAGQGALMVALDAKSGRQLWQTDALEGEAPAYSSAIMIDTDQGHQIISGSSEHTFGVDAVTGRLIWKYRHEIEKPVMLTPGYCNGKILVSLCVRTNACYYALALNTANSQVELKRKTLPAV